MAGINGFGNNYNNYNRYNLNSNSSSTNKQNKTGDIKFKNTPAGDGFVKNNTVEVNTDLLEKTKGAVTKASNNSWLGSVWAGAVGLFTGLVGGIGSFIVGAFAGYYDSNPDKYQEHINKIAEDTHAAD